MNFNGQPFFREFYETSSYLGLQHFFFNRKLQGALLLDGIRSWRVQGSNFAAGQVVVPAVRFDYRPNRRWEINGSFAFSRGVHIRDYDNTDTTLLISYVKPLHRGWKDGTGEHSIEYPLRFSIGVEQEDFYRFAGQGQTMYRPIFRLTLF